MMSHVRAITAVSAPLLRMRLRALGLEPGLELVGEASTGAQAAELAIGSKPDVILCDERIANDPALVALCAHQIPSHPNRIVLLAQGSRPGLVPPPIAVAATLASEASIASIAAGLIEVVTASSRPRSTRPPQVVQQLSTRFSLANLDPAVPEAQSDGTSPEPSERAAGATDRQRQTPPAATTWLGAGRRQQTPARDRLQDLLAAVRHQHQDERDLVTGLPNLKVLGVALESLAAAGCPSAIIVAHVSLPKTQAETLDEATMASIARAASAAVLANVRQEDIVCRLDDLTFSIVMPGLERHAQERPVLRIRAALLRIQDSAMLPGITFHMATGAGFWTPSMRPEQPLEEAWAEMLGEREAYASESPAEG